MKNDGIVDPKDEHSKLFDEVKNLEKKLPIPDFLEDDEETEDGDSFFGFETEADEDATSDEQQEEAIAKLDDVKNEHTHPSGIFYRGLESFLTEENIQPFPIDLFFENIFSDKGEGSVFAEIANREILVEKNYLMKTLRDIIDSESRSLFDSDFLLPKSFEIYDANKINALLDKIDTNNYFIRFGAHKKKMVYNLLLSSLDKKESYRLGWFVKLSFSAHHAIGNFMNSFAEEARFEIVATSQKEIEQRLFGLNDLTTTY